MPTLADHAHDVLEVFKRRRDPTNKIRPITSVEMLAALAHNQQAGRNLGNTVALLDAACICADLPWLGRLIDFKTPKDDFTGPWSSWAPYKQYICRSAPSLRQWTDGDFNRIDAEVAALPQGPEEWWKQQGRNSDVLLCRALLVVLRQAFDEPRAL